MHNCHGLAVRIDSPDNDVVPRAPDRQDLRSGQGFIIPVSFTLGPVYLPVVNS
jgi:hypothetical protein